MSQAHHASVSYNVCKIMLKALYSNLSLPCICCKISSSFVIASAGGGGSILRNPLTLFDQIPPRGFLLNNLKNGVEEDFWLVNKSWGTRGTKPRKHTYLLSICCR